ncbi:MAG TPA: DUF305 domain-containing protein [Gemmatimonadales bacterium]|jgi:uncharacterized protein (DUF305 family)
MRESPPRVRHLCNAIAIVASCIVIHPAAAQSAPDYIAPDVQFMQGMIYHHAQAVAMADWAHTHGASQSVTLFCKKVALTQEGEIKLMQQWLLDRHLAAPDPLGYLHHDTAAMNMPGMSKGAMDMTGHMMPGMLTPDQMALLDASTGATFDRFFLTFMIQHHEGALGMVQALFDAGGGQQADLFAFANNVQADQSAEIRVMQGMLSAYTKE